MFKKENIDNMIAKGIMPDVHAMGREELKEYLFRYMYLSLGFYASDYNYEGESEEIQILLDSGYQAKEAINLVNILKQTPEDVVGKIYEA